MNTLSARLVAGSTCLAIASTVFVSCGIPLFSSSEPEQFILVDELKTDTPPADDVSVLVDPWPKPVVVDPPVALTVTDSPISAAPVESVTVTAEPTPADFDEAAANFFRLAELHRTHFDTGAALTAARPAGLPVVIVFRQTHCKPCDEYEKNVIYTGEIQMARGEKFVLCCVNCDEDPEARERYGVERTPGVVVQKTTRDGRGETMFRYVTRERPAPATAAELVAVITGETVRKGYKPVGCGCGCDKCTGTASCNCGCPDCRCGYNGTSSSCPDCPKPKPRRPFRGLLR